MCLRSGCARARSAGERRQGAELGEDRGAEPRALVEARGLRQVTDLGAIDSAVDAVIAANPDKAEQAKTKPGMLGWFVGQVMKSTGGKANPQAVSDALKKRLGL